MGTKQYSRNKAHQFPIWQQHFWIQTPDFRELTGEANDGASAHNQVRVSEDPRLLRSTEAGCLRVWTRLPPSRRPNNWDTIEKLVWSFLGETNLEEILLKKHLGKYKLGRVFSSIAKSHLFLSVCVDDINVVEKTDKMELIWTSIWKIHPFY